MTHPLPVDHGYHAGPSEMASVGAATPFRIRRLGARPLVFKGTELAMAMSFTPQLPYWYEINVYRTDRQKFVLCIKQFFVAENETDTSDAWEFETLADAFDAIEAYDAGRDVRFEPNDIARAPAAELAARAMSLRSEVEAARAHFAGLAGELFQDLEEAA
ncbi:hypothetical protein P6F26_08220 [Roseibacterium sp. SDUM158017]|uniref:hypothetical protein n=1 Tax=Roseicyclus salinarum TaxID=3036773 RepID=UPI0024153692|nr:hypothetical protein [Roseibacterium sp. SDUM158017]MDG4648428.1 hypothetical protein [Roseibacterium sp. SDUM158017]